ncbi:MAG: hypothetical protein DSZ24_06490 [Thermodesulfatator sp.]|nr:MAG: hypothetical protein DSZ24_06490 [Thermodesulfatator sp.]
MWRPLFWKTVWQRFSEDRDFTEAQALTYTTLFSLIPLLALAFAVARLFIQAEELIERSQEFLSRFLNPAAIDTVQDTLFRLLNQAERAPLGKASMLIFLTMIVGLLMQTEGVLNRIFRVSRSRSIPQKITAYWMILTLGPVLMILPPAASFYLTHFTRKILVTWLLKILYVLTVCLFFSGLYFYLPNRRVRLSATLFGGAVAGFLWLTAAYLYAFYTTKAVAYSKLYGSLSALPFFLLWLFISWAITLFGAEAAAVYEERQWLGNGYRLPQEVVAVALALELAQAYEAGQAPLPIPKLVESLHLSPGEIEKVVEILEARGILVRTEEGLLLAVSPRRLFLRDIVAPLLGSLPESLPESPSLRRASELFREREKLLERTLAEV